MGTQHPYPKRGRAPSPILRVEVENFKIGPEEGLCGALPVIADFVALEQQITVLVSGLFIPCVMGLIRGLDKLWTGWCQDYSYLVTTLVHYDSDQIYW